MRFSTGKEARVTHSTGTEWQEVEALKKKRNARVRYSTGRDSRVLHFTGTLTGYDPPDEEEDEQQQHEGDAEAAAKDKKEHAELRFPWGESRYEKIRRPPQRSRDAGSE